MKKMNLLGKAEMKNVLGGLFKDICDGLSGPSLENCQYNACMAGWDSSQHTAQQNADKIDTCAGNGAA